MATKKFRRIGIFYFSPSNPRASRKKYGMLMPNAILIKLSGDLCGWIRVEEPDYTKLHDEDYRLSDALDQARPRRGEMVMNAHYLE